MHAGAAAELDDRSRRQLADPGQEIEAGPQPFIGELEIYCRIPRHRAASPLPFRSDPVFSPSSRTASDNIGGIRADFRGDGIRRQVRS